ncbi:DUF4124 domain-containing protein [Alkanindiges sp. WGS2144]|uniref:DUF4124 domain-containing protein n=1 Tax=Alkanindiges sp. WGS2144 TaxID=3366808 RepID=UPI0037502894
MMRQLIINKLLLQQGFLNLSLPVYLFTGLILCCFLNPAYAQSVQRWQDQQGQWHFGDQAAAKGHNTQPVLIKNPISVVKNDLPAPPITSQLKPRRYNHNGSHQQTPSQPATRSAQHKEKCANLREQIHGRTLNSKATRNGKVTQHHQNLVERYERECIAGHYYGN